MQSRAYEVSVNQSEQLRVQELEHYLTVIEEGESELHSLVNLLAKLCKTPFCGVSVVDNNTVWIKAHYGIEASCLPREGAFCAAAVDCNQDIFYVENTLKDSRFINNPLVQSAPQIRFYAAAPIFSSTGFAIGTLWIMDTKPLQISDEIIVILRSLSTYLTHILYSQYRCEVTQLPNRLGFIRRLQAQINLNPDQKVFVGTAHIQKMKYLSIIYDNEVKNSLILAMSQRLRSFPNWTLLSHIGEGNFAFAWFGEDKRSDVERLLATLCEPIPIKDTLVSITVNIGITCSSSGQSSSVALLDLAELASHEWNKAGIANVHYEQADCNNTMIMAVRACLHTDSLDNYITPYYQPQIDIASGVLVGFEALLRWHNPQFQNVPLHQLFELIEINGIVPAIDLLIFKKVCEHISQWRASGLTLPKISTNISRTTLQTNQLTNQLLTIAEKYGLSPNLFTLEITESGVPLEDRILFERINTLRQAGFNIAIDDFGTGMSNIATLKNIDSQLLKVDRQFAHGASANGHIAALLRLIKGTADSLNIALLVEGIEEQEDVDWLRSAGIDLVQGWYFAKALTPELIPSVLSELRQQPKFPTIQLKIESVKRVFEKLTHQMLLR